MKKVLFVVTLCLLLPALQVSALDFSVGLSVGYTPFSLNKALADTVLNDNASWLQFDADAAESATVSAGSVPRNLAIALTAEAKLSKLFFVQVDFAYALGLGGARTFTDASANLDGARNADKSDQVSFISVPVYFGIRQGIFRFAVGINFTSVTYSQKGTFSDAAKVTDNTISYDRSWSGSVIGWNLLFGTEYALSSSMTLGIDLVYLSAPIELKFEGKQFLDQTDDVFYKAFNLDGWLMNVAVKLKL